MFPAGYEKPRRNDNVLMEDHQTWLRCNSHVKHASHNDCQPNTSNMKLSRAEAQLWLSDISSVADDGNGLVRLLERLHLLVSQLDVHGIDKLLEVLQRRRPDDRRGNA
jgi:hypothetical protein